MVEFSYLLAIIIGNFRFSLKTQEPQILQNFDMQHMSDFDRYVEYCRNIDSVISVFGFFSVDIPLCFHVGTDMWEKTFTLQRTRKRDLSKQLR